MRKVSLGFSELGAAALLLFMGVGTASAAETQLVIRDCQGTPRAVETVTEGSSQKVQAVIVDQEGAFAKAGTEVIISSKSLAAELKAITSENGMARFESLKPATYTLCPTDSKQFKVSKITLERKPSGSAALIGGGVFAAAATTGIALGTSGSSGGGSSFESASITASTVGGGTGASISSEATLSSSSAGSLIPGTVELDQEASVPSQSNKKKVRKPATCNKTVLNALGDSEEACRTNETPDPVSPVS